MVSPGDIQAPAKCNLGLRVGPPRADGYHPIESVFVPLALADRLSFAIAGEGIGLEIHGPASDGIPAGPENLVRRAALAFCRAAGLPAALAITLEKRVPSPGGLGGGSSDAGAVLRWLSAEAPGRVPPAQLAVLALELGADVPYFLDPTPALVEGIGEEITPLLGVPALPIVWAHPGPEAGAALSTPRVYAELDRLRGVSGALTPSGAASSIRRLLGLSEPDPDSDPAAATTRFDPTDEAWLRALLVNELEPAATRLCPPVGRLREAIEASGALASAMSGSGPTVYGVYEDDAHAAAAVPALREHAARVEQTTTSPSRGHGPGGPRATP